MTASPNLQEADVRRWVGSASFGRAQRYARQKAIHQGRRIGDTLKAQSMGSRPMPYEVEVTLDADGIASAYCSCPVGDGGHCKHVAALLLTWLDDPEAFPVMEDLDTALARRTKEELIALIRSMVARHPDFELLVAQPTPGAASQEAVSTAFIRRQVDKALAGSSYEYGWGASYGLSGELDEILSTGDAYAAGQDWKNAAAVYMTVAEGILDEYEEIYDDEGDVAMVLSSCAEKLAPCLAGIDDPGERERILRALFDIYRGDVMLGGYGIADEVPGAILEHATPEERRHVAEWVREEIVPRTDDGSTNWGNEAYGGFLLDLEADILDDESYLRICRETGRLDNLIERLLALNRAEEALADACKAGDYRLLNVANQFVQSGHGEAIRKLIMERAQTSKDQRLTTWLRDYAADHDDWDTALRLSKDLFQTRPSVSSYKEVRAAAKALDRWEAVRRTLLEGLRQQERYSTLTEIYLAENKIDKALETVRLKPKRAGGFGFYGYGPDTSLKIRVAKAAEESHPHDAIDIYLNAVRQLIEQRGRDNYAQAAEYLKRIQTAYLGLNEPERWQLLIAEIRESNKRLPALKDELNKAKL